MPGMSDFFHGSSPSRRMGSGRGFGLGLGGADPGEARALALLNALGPMQEAGLQRSAGPMGSIAKNLIPLFGAIIQGKLLEQQAAQQQQMLEQQSAQQQEKLGLEKQRLETETARTQALRSPSNLQQLLVQAVQSGDTEKMDQVVGLMKQTQSAAQPNRWALALQAAGGDPQKALDVVLGQQEKLSSYKEGIKPKPTSKETSTDMTPKERRAMALNIAKADIASNGPNVWIQDSQGKNVRRKSVQERMVEVEQELLQQAAGATKEPANSLKEQAPADASVKLPQGWKIEVSP